jgi:hypothetical protein
MIEIMKSWSPEYQLIFSISIIAAIAISIRYCLADVFKPAKTNTTEKKIWVVPEEMPLFKHNCHYCTFLGCYYYSKDPVFISPFRYDLYHCSNYTGNKCVLARYGDEDDKYIIDENSPVLKEAKKRAIEIENSL